MTKQPDIDSHKLIFHPERVSQWFKEKDCYPIYVEIGPTNRCNHRCTFCALDWVGKGITDIDKDVMLKTLKDMAKKGVKSVMFAGEGEPFLHKDICLFVQYAKKSGLDISITTNGVLFEKEKIKACLPHLSWVRFSVDAGTKETYSEIHKTSPEDFNKLLENLKEAVRFKRDNNLDVVIGVQFLLIHQNIKEAVKLTEICSKIGVDNIQIKPYSQHPNSINKFVVNYEDYAYLDKELEKFNTDKFRVMFRKATMQRLNEEVNYNQCYGLSFFALIDTNGDIIPCNLFYGKQEYTYGNLYKNSFSEIWEGEKRKQVLEKLKKEGTSSCREGCRLDAINRYLYNLRNPHSHVNFI